MTVTGTVNILTDTPIYDGQVYKLNFSTATAGFSNDGLIEGLNQNHFVTYRHNQVVVVDNVLDTQRLTIRPALYLSLMSVQGLLIEQQNLQQQKQQVKIYQQMKS